MPIDDEQAQYILDMPIKRLSRLNRFKLQEERETKGRAGRRDRAHPRRLRRAARDRRRRASRRTAEKLGAPRRTLLGGETRVARLLAASPRAPSRCRDRGRPAHRRGAVRHRAAAPARRDRSTAACRACRSTVGAGDAVATAVFTDTESELNAYTSDGQVLRLRVADVPIESRVSRGVKAVGLGRGSELVALLPLAPRGGHVLLTSPSEARSSGRRRPSSPGAHGRLAGDRPPGRRSGGRRGAHGDGDEVLLHSAHGRTLRFEAGKVRPVKSPAAGGVAGMHLDRGDRVVAAGVAPGDVLLVMHELGHGKAVPLAEYPVKGRATGGVVSANPGVPKKEPAGPVAAAVALPAAAEAMVLTASGGLARFAVAQLEPASRAAVSRISSTSSSATRWSPRSPSCSYLGGASERPADPLAFAPRAPRARRRAAVRARRHGGRRPSRRGRARRARDRRAAADGHGVAVQLPDLRHDGLARPACTAPGRRDDAVRFGVQATWLAVGIGIVVDAVLQLIARPAAEPDRRRPGADRRGRLVAADRRASARRSSSSRSPARAGCAACRRCAGRSCTCSARTALSAGALPPAGVPARVRPRGLGDRERRQPGDRRGAVPPRAAPRAASAGSRDWRRCARSSARRATSACARSRSR